MERLEPQDISVKLTVAPDPRTAHVCASVGNRMLIWGGYNEAGINSEKYLTPEFVDVYHMEHKYWTIHPTSGDIPEGTSGAGACFVPSCDCLLVFGGHMYEGNTNCMYMLDLKTFTWKNLKPEDPEIDQSWPSPRDKFCCWVYSEKFFCFGGYGVPIKEYLKGNGVFYRDNTSQWPLPKGWNNQLLEYDIKSGKWSSPECQGILPLPRAAGTTVRFGSLVYLFGGRHDQTRMNDLHCLNLDNYTWSGELHVEGDVPCGRSWHTLTAVSHNTAFLYGGFTSDCTVLGDGWLLNVTSRQWTRVSVPPDKPRLWHTCCCSDDSEIIVFGGCHLNILDYNIYAGKITNEVLSLHLQPYKLQRLCLEAAYKYKDQQECLWSTLPRNLADWLDKHREIGKLMKNIATDSDPKPASACVLS